MKNIKWILPIIILLSSCSEKQTDNVEIEFNFNHTLTWDTSSNRFVENKNFRDLKVNYIKNRNAIIESILDTTSLNIKSCIKQNSKLRKGDLSIILMKSIEYVYFSKIFSGNQFDNFRNCNYPIGLFDHIERNRITFVEKLKKEKLELK
ncbi:MULTISPECIES: hypothetical protein [unclassified Flavobacterium]|uniref:hypothetical protein n=1 Tax=unclassified Flavobacterium TaxID=196869 RepID=UPI001291A5C1|nr:MULTISPECIES: hypothetical protein [unclassified Flavobacterium]MQP53022.1 hypothetical protein [Flavobacterium sp. LMO9]MQP62843.1 hypothetical protein [Flavobacterium sp. LMO6]